MITDKGLEQLNKEAPPGMKFSRPEDERQVPLTPEQARKVAALAAFCADDLADAPMCALSFVAELFPECREYAEPIFREYHGHTHPDHPLDNFRIGVVDRQEYLKILEDLG